jgi:hypothetical protein
MVPAGSSVINKTNTTMREKQTLLGVQSPGEELEIRDFQRIKRVETIREGLFDGTAGPVLSEDREVFLDAWSGKTGDGHPVHVSYRFGELMIDIDLPTPEGGRQPLTVLRWKPRLALGLITPVPGRIGNGPAPSREERARLAEADAELAEVRALNASKPRLLGEGELRHWLEERNRHFALLSDRGLAGGQLRFRLTRPERKQEEAA